LNDHETFPFLVQAELLEYEVKNYGVPGYGTLQAYMLLNKAVLLKDIPDVVVLNYASFHAERDLMAPGYLKKLYPGFEMFNIDRGNMVYPRIVVEEDTFRIERVQVDLAYCPLPGIKKSATINALEDLWAKLGTSMIQNVQVSELLIGEINQLCLTNDIELIIAEVDEPEVAGSISQFCTEQGINYVNIAPRFSDGSFRLLPFDNHPNPKANQFYCDKLVNYLSGIGLH
jgi:hypothetical protein